MKRVDKKVQVVVGLLVIGALGFWLASYYVQKSLTHANSYLDQAIATNEAKIKTDITNLQTNTLPEGGLSYIRDCSEVYRNEFDNKLDKLGSLSPADQDRVQVLFEACASYFADRKAALVDLMKNDIAHHTVLVEQKKIVGTVTNETGLEDWNRFLSLQEKQAALLYKQVSLQKEVMSLLQQGSTPLSTEVRDKMREAAEVAQQGTVLNQQILQLQDRLQ